MREIYDVKQRERESGCWLEASLTVAVEGAAARARHPRGARDPGPTVTAPYLVVTFILAGHREAGPRSPATSSTTPRERHAVLSRQEKVKSHGAVNSRSGRRCSQTLLEAIDGCMEGVCFYVEQSYLPLPMLTTPRAQGNGYGIVHLEPSHQRHSLIR